ncbi:MAG: translation initiation factor IF-3 [Methylacidiphilales bacterium]|nr:translation initiation factor IF-3 [Candidatus Methylacidiphilales bacterium]
MRINNRIRAREVLVIGPDGHSLGLMEVSTALIQARKHNLDLVEVSPKARPPVCKILDYGKYRYELSKRDKEARKQNAAAKVKELKFHVNIDGHDYDTKLRHAETFLFRGMKAKCMLVFRGREMQHQDLGKELVARIRKDLEHVGLADAEPKLIGRNINLMLTPLPLNKRARKFTKESDTEFDEEEEGGADSATE